MASTARTTNAAPEANPAPPAPTTPKAGSTPHPTRRSAAMKSGALLLIVPAVLFVAWAALAAMVDSLVFPGPLDAVTGLLSDLGSETFRTSALSTVRLLLISWALAAAIGGLLGFALGLSPFWAKVFQTPLFAFYSIPKVTLYPIFLLLLGVGEAGRIAFAFFHGVFPMALLVMGATASLDTKYLKLADALCLPWHVRLRSILLPALLPSVVTALRIAFGLTLLGLVLGEMFNSDIGLGRELIDNVSQVSVDRIAGQVLFIAGIALGPSLLLRWLERRTTSRYGTP